MAITAAFLFLNVHVEMGLRVCSNGDPPLTVMPIYGKIMINKKNKQKKPFFLKTKNCSNDNPFINCNDRLKNAYLQWLFHSGE